MFGKVVVAREMLPIEIGSFSFRRFDSGTGKHDTPPRVFFRNLPLPRSRILFWKSIYTVNDALSSRDIFWNGIFHFWKTLLP